MILAMFGGETPALQAVRCGFESRLRHQSAPVGQGMVAGLRNRSMEVRVLSWTPSLQEENTAVPETKGDQPDEAKDPDEVVEKIKTPVKPMTTQNTGPLAPIKPLAGKK